MIACSDTKSNDSSINTQKGVHFFVDDYRFNGIYNNPEKSLSKYSQYAFLLTPDFSTYADMNLWRQIENVAKKDGVEENSIVTFGIIRCKHNRFNFLHRYYIIL